MSNRPILTAFLFVGALLAVSSSSAGAAGRPSPPTSRPRPLPRPRPAVLRWPLEAPGPIQSSFGEYRYDHLHAGIDISTGGGTGLKVLAADAGVVYRLKVEWRGYGRALYIRHPNGRVTVYGHLERYEDRTLHLERLVARRQAQAGTRYPGDIYPDPPVRVVRGQLVAYSGESGVGLPHLHFEVRDASDAPIDPFDAGLQRPIDHRPPIAESLLITAASAPSFVDGDQRQSIVPLSRIEAGLSRAAHPIRVSGPFLASVLAYDPVGDGGRAGLATIETKIDGVLRYRLAIHSFRFDQYPVSGLIFDHRFSRLGPATFAYRLFRLPGNEFGADPDERSSSIAEGASPGAFELEPGLHPLQVEITDAEGNRTRVEACIASRAIGADGAAEWSSDPQAGQGVRIPPPVGDSDQKPASVRPDGPSACPREPAALDAGRWDSERRAFHELRCLVDRGFCPVPSQGAAGAAAAVRVRETSFGVPGPWQLLLQSPTTLTAIEGVSPVVEAWPGYLDVLLPLDAPFPPPLRLAAGLSREALREFAYRTGSIFATAVEARRVAGRAPFFVVGEDARVVASLPLDVLWTEPGHSLDYPGPGFTLHLPEKGRFYPGPLVVRTERIQGEESLPAIADAVDILPDGEALDDRGTLSFDLSRGAVPPESLGVYRWDARSGHWSYEGGDLDEGGTRLSLPFRRYGCFALLQDASPPELREIRPSEGARLATRRPVLSASVSEIGMGLNFDGVVFELDGRVLESEFDPDRAVSKVLAPPLLSAGPHHLRVTAVDRAGNRSAPVERDFRVDSR